MASQLYKALGLCKVLKRHFLRSYFLNFEEKKVTTCSLEFIKVHTKAQETGNQDVTLKEVKKLKRRKFAQQWLELKINVLIYDVLQILLNQVLLEGWVSPPERSSANITRMLVLEFTLKHPSNYSQVSTRLSNPTLTILLPRVI